VIEKLDLAYRITHVELDIQAAQEEDRYRPSQWLTLIRPPTPTTVGAADVPVAWRELPVRPTLTSQTGLPQTQAPCPPPEAVANDPLQHRFTYAQANVAQSTGLPDVKLNIRSTASTTTAVWKVALDGTHDCRSSPRADREPQSPPGITGAGPGRPDRSGGGAPRPLSSQHPAAFVPTWQRGAWPSWGNQRKGAPQTGGLPGQGAENKQVLASAFAQLASRC